MLDVNFWRIIVSKQLLLQCCFLRSCQDMSSYLFLKKKKIQTLIANILKNQKYYMSFEKKPRHLANFSLAKEHGYLKKNTIYLLQQFKGPTL